MENKVTYTIDYQLSLRYRTPVITVSSTAFADKDLYARLMDDELNWRQREKSKQTTFPYFRLRPLHSYEYLQRLVITKRLFYKDKPIIGDFFSQLKLEYLAEPTKEGVVVHAFLDGQPLSDYELVLQGSPHVVMKEQKLSFCDASISWSELGPFCQGPKLFSKADYLRFKKDLSDVVCLELDDKQAAPAPLKPTLHLVDHSLSFANLPKECSEFEKELIALGFLKKPMPTSNYYCPTDRSLTAIESLLEKGWTVINAQGKELVSITGYELSLEKEYRVQGKTYFKDEEVAISDLVKAVHADNRLFSLPSGKSALLSFSKHKELETLFKEVELISDTPKLPKRAIAALANLSFDCFDESLGARLRAGFKATTCGQKPVGNGFIGKLRPYQQDGLNWLWALYESGLNGLLADEMGLGKTVQVLAFLEAIDTRALIVVPTTLLHQWKHQAHDFVPQKKVFIYHGPQRTPQELHLYDIIITSYATVRSDIEELQRLDFGALILDEAQAIKNSSTLTFQAITQLNAHFRLSLTGTPIENSLSELASHFRFLDPTLLGENLSSLAEVRKKIAPFILRRKKCDVAKDLPEKIEETVFVTMNDEQQKLYDRFLGSLKQGLLQKVHSDGVKKHRMQIFEAILRLRQICCHPMLVPQLVEELAPQATTSGKCELVLQDIETLLAEEKKVVLFSQFATQLELLAKEAKTRNWPYLLLDGKTKDRQTLVDTFQNDPQMPLFFISLKAGGVGLNLSKADYVLLYDPWWNRAQENQAIDRAHRIGRKEAVFSKRYITSNTIEEKIRLLQEKKHKLADALLDENGEALTFDDLTELLE